MSTTQRRYKDNLQHRLSNLVRVSLSDSPLAWCATCGPCGPGVEPETEQSPVGVSPWGPVGPLSPPEGTPPARPGPLDAGEAHTLHSKLPHTTPVGQRAGEQ